MTGEDGELVAKTPIKRFRGWLEEKDDVVFWSPYEVFDMFPVTCVVEKTQSERNDEK